MSARSCRTRTALGALAGVVAVLPWGSVAVAEPRQEPPTSCEIERLPVPDNEGNRVSGSGPDGAPLLGTIDRYEDDHYASALALWRDGDPEVTELPGGVVDAFDMNGDGLVVGDQYDNELGNTVAWAHDENGPRLLENGAHAEGVNEAGKIAGYRMEPTDNGPAIAVPVTWPSSSEEPVDLERPNNGIGEAKAVGEDGSVFGHVDREAIRWTPEGEVEVLPRPDDVDPHEDLTVVDVNGPWVLGGGYHVPLLWNLDTGEVTHVPEIATATKVNEHGWVVGQTSDHRGVLAAGETVVDLPGFGKDYMHLPHSVSPDGRTIAGMAQPRGNPSGMTEEAVVWRCS